MAHSAPYVRFQQQLIGYQNLLQDYRNKFSVILVTADAQLTHDSYNNNKFSSAANIPVYQPP